MIFLATWPILVVLDIYHQIIQHLLFLFFNKPNYVTESLYVFPCQWNYRPDHCIYGSNCHEAEQEGVFILHGNRGVYHDDKQPAFRAVYDAIQKVEEASTNQNQKTSLFSESLLIFLFFFKQSPSLSKE